ncbi:hypothetical protein NUW58_g3796 [Xylaria curta]|uniref:Uncharacterized protein n=1 Tax=Xylaria curta TaxID=42375 RepID=A0ACC1PAY2_9PEZI|nr:hypothetical protein NUW58_g3796 [Xylaria curta]
MSEPSVNNSDTSSTAAVVIHESYPQPAATEFDGMDEIKFHHPGYPPPHDILFILPRLDRSSSLQGVHHGTALTACQIIANNAFDGYLAKDREGCERVDSNLDFNHLLTESNYWFFVASTPSNLNPYPIVPSFQDWAFPHQRIPRWPQPKHTANSNIIDHRCIITQTAGFINQAHLIPAAEKKWFEINAMSQYGSHRDINQKHNKIALRHDLHFAFDTHLFAIVPKNNHYVAHQLHATETSTMEFAFAYHNYKVVQQPRNVTPEFLFARFARAILMLIKPFIAQAPINRYVSRFRAVNNENGGSNEYNIKSEWLSPEQLADQYGGGGTKSASPSKRKRNGEGNSDNGDNSDTEDEWYKENVAVLLEGDRGRPRKRRWDDQQGQEYEEDNDNSDTEGEWYEKNVAVALEGDRGRSRKRRCDDSRHNNSQPPSLSTSISSIQSCTDLERETTSYSGARAAFDIAVVDKSEDSRVVADFGQSS